MEEIEAKQLLSQLCSDAVDIIKVNGKTIEVKKFEGDLLKTTVRRLEGYGLDGDLTEAATLILKPVWWIVVNYYGVIEYPLQIDILNGNKDVERNLGYNEVAEKACLSDPKGLFGKFAPTVLARINKYCK